MKTIQFTASAAFVVTLVVTLVLALATAGCAGSQSNNPEILWPPPGAAGTARSPATAEPAPAPAPKPPALRLGDAAQPTSYRAELTIDPTQESFTGAVEIELMLAAAADHIWLHGTELTVAEASIEMGGERWPVTRIATDDEDFLGFALGRQVAPGAATLRVRYSGAISPKDFSGMFRQQEGGAWYVFTQFESISARRVFPCFDEPRFKVPWQLALTVRDGDEAFTNTPVASQTAGPQPGWKTIQFARTRPLPSYLIALAVGPFDTVDMGRIGRAKVPARIIAPRGRGAEARYVAQITPKILTQLEDYFDSPYPYAKLDSVAIPSFPGAMEHPGLITYGQTLLLAKPEDETADFKRGYVNVGAHELAHQWFGNQVTLAWWDDVWLNESFATWASIKVSDKVMPEWDIDVVRAERMGGTMGVDSLITARQIRQPIESRDDILGAFDAISYGKGSAVLSMFERWVGEDKFRDGIRAYLREHADKTATSADFLAAISAVSRPEVSPAVRTFLDQPGVPLVSMALSCERGAAPKLTLSQERFLPAGSKGSTAQTWHIPICVEYGVGRDAKRQCTLLTEARAELALDTRTCPRWVQGNADAAGYYHVAYPAGMIGALLGKAKRHQSIAEQIGVISDARAQVAAGKASIGESLALVPTLMRDKNHHIVLAAVQLAARVDREMIPNALRANHARFIRKMFGARARKLGWTPGKRDSDHTRELRQNLVPLVADVGADRRLIQRAIALTETWLTTRKGVDSSLLGAVLVTAARNGGADMHAKLFAALEGTQDKRERNAITTAVAATTEPALINKNLDWFLTSDRDIFEMFAILQVPLSRSETRQQVYDWIKANYEGLTGKLPRMAHRFIVYSAAAFCDDAHYKDTKAFFEPKLSHIPGGPRALAQTLEGIQLCMGYRAAQQANIEAFLRKY